MKLKVLLIVSLLCLLFVSPVYAKDMAIIGKNMQVSNMKPTVNVVGIKYNLGLEYRDIKKDVVSNNSNAISIISGGMKNTIQSNKSFVNNVSVFPETYVVPDLKSGKLVNSLVLNNSLVVNDFINTIPEEKVEMGDIEYSQGEFQGPWGDLSEYVDELSGRRKYRTKELIEYVGTAPVNEGIDTYEYEVDRWKEVNGKGVVRYSQGGSALEDWAYLSSGDSNFVNSGCGAYSASCVLSTMLGKYINVPEVAIAINTYEVRNPDSDLVLCNSDGDGAGAFCYTDLAAVIEEAGLKTETLETFDIDKVDKCLENGGMVIYVVDSSYGCRYTGGHHYVVIREKTKTGYLVYSSTNWSTPYYDDYCNTENTASELKRLESSNGAQMVLVNY